MAHTALDLNVGQDGKYEIFTNGKFNGEYIGPSIATTAIDGDFEIRKKYSRDGEQIPITIKNCNAYKVSITQLEVPVPQSLEHTQEKGKSTTTQKNASEGWTSTTTLSLRGRLLDATDCLGNETHYSYDDYGRCTLADSPAASNSFIYSGDKLTQEVIEDKSTSTRLTVDYEYDKRDREVRRSFSCDGFPTIVLSRDYDVLGRVVQSELIKDGLPLRKETFNYNARGQLIGYGCEGEARPVTPWGKVLTEQYFAYDELGNMVTCATVTDEGTYTTAYRYGTIDRTQLESQTSEGDSSPPAVSYTYDKQGRLIKTLEGDQQSIYAYNRIGKLAKCSRQVLADGSVSDRDDFAYVYARSGELIAQTGDGSTDYIFCGQRRVGRRSSNSHMLLLNNSPSALLQRHARGNAEPHHSFELCDAQGSLVASFDLSSKELNTFAYTPFGYRPTDANDTHWLGFNGEALDTYNKGIYHLGEGYRMYDPRHQRFMAPDSESPFGMGGANPYAYCLNDPVNFSDPTGHVPITYQSSQYITLPITLNPIYRAIVFGGIGIALAPFTGGASLALTTVVVGLAIVSAAFDIAAAATQESNPELSAWLNRAGTFTGIASAGMGMFGAKLAALKGAKIGLSAAPKKWITVEMGEKSTQSKFGRNLQSYDALFNELHYATDVHKGGRRITINAHGAFDAEKGHAFVINGDELLDAYRLKSVMAEKGVVLENFDHIRLLVCHSGEAEKGALSLAENLHQLTGKPVKGFLGTVRADYEMSEVIQLMKADTGLGTSTLKTIKSEGFAVQKNRPWNYRPVRYPAPGGKPNPLNVSHIPPPPPPTPNPFSFDGVVGSINSLDDLL